MIATPRSDGFIPGLGPRPATLGTKPSVERFLDTYVDSQGRVVRHDQGGDTVSEGQAYAMLLAAAIGDRGRFDRVWTWTEENLQRRNGLLSYLWRDGGVADPQPATDADLDAAQALLAAAERWGEARYEQEAMRIARGLLRRETVKARRGRVLAAGPWALMDRPYVVNPSYFSPRGLGELGEASGSRRFDALVRTGYRHASALIGDPLPLPPDWATATGARTRPAGAPGEEGASARYGFDAARVPVRLAIACEPAGPRLAAALWPFFHREEAEGEITSAYTLRGETLDATPHPVGLVGAAAAADAAGDGSARDALLRKAELLDIDHSTYYGSAWVALGRVMLTTDLLGGCP